MPQCAGVTLSASYLAAMDPDQGPAAGPGFRFTLVNGTARAIRLVEPVPTSSHWYARTRGRWLWRASNGAGGGLVDAGNEHGRLAVYPPTGQMAGPEVMTVPPRQSRSWIAGPQQNPVLAYQPGCRQCSFPGEREYQVVFAYAYAPGSGATADLLPCGLRSRPVPMPPKS